MCSEIRKCEGVNFLILIEKQWLQNVEETLKMADYSFHVTSKKSGVQIEYN